MQVKLHLLKRDLTMTMVMMVENRRKKHTKKIKGFKLTVKKKELVMFVQTCKHFPSFPQTLYSAQPFFSPSVFFFRPRTNSFFSRNNVCRSFCPNNGQSALRRSSSRCSVKLWSVLISSQPLRQILMSRIETLILTQSLTWRNSRWPDPKLCSWSPSVG